MPCKVSSIIINRRTNKKKNHDTITKDGSFAAFPSHGNWIYAKHTMTMFRIVVVEQAIVLDFDSDSKRRTSKIMA